MDEIVQALNRVLGGTVNSLIQFLDIATPYVPPGYEGQVETLARLKEEEAAQANQLYAAVQELGGVPKVGIFPYWNVDLNYLDLRFLVRFTAEKHAEVVASAEAELDHVRPAPNAHRVLKEVLAQKRAHLETLRELVAFDDEQKAKAEAKKAAADEKAAAAKRAKPAPKKPPAKA